MKRMVEGSPSGKSWKEITSNQIEGARFKSKIFIVRD